MFFFVDFPLKTLASSKDSCFSLEEQQAVQKQAEELRRMKKRQRQMTPRHKDGPKSWFTEPTDRKDLPFEQWKKGSLVVV